MAKGNWKYLIWKIKILKIRISDVWCVRLLLFQYYIRCVGGMLSDGREEFVCLREEEKWAVDRFEGWIQLSKAEGRSSKQKWSRQWILFSWSSFTRNSTIKKEKNANNLHPSEYSRRIRGCHLLHALSQEVSFLR